MQQRRPRLGDVIDDYCPRERRITNHAVVAMIEDGVKQTRCTTCDAEHEYKQAKVPSTRKRKTAEPAAQLVDAPNRPPEGDDLHDQSAPLAAAPDDAPESIESAGSVEQPELAVAAPADIDEVVEPESESETVSEDGDRDEWPVHRPLIRAQLPRPEGHTPERKEPDFTMRQGGRFDQNRNNGQRHRGYRQGGRQAQGHSPSGSGGNSRFGGQRGSGFGQGGGQGQGQRQGNRSGQGGGGNRAGQGPGRGPRPGGGRKRGR